MFTDGLDTSALQWVRKEQKERTASTPASGKGSPDITRYDYSGACTPSGRNRILPPPQLSQLHIHSQVLRAPFSSDLNASTTDDFEESVGSISGGNPTYDGYDSGEEQESGRYSPDSSPSGSSGPNNPAYSRRGAGDAYKHDKELQEAQGGKTPLKAEPIEVEDYYDGPLSRRESFGKRDSTLRRDGSGRRDSSRRDDSGRKDSFGRRDSFELLDGRPGAYTGSGRFDPDYGREDVLERPGAYTGSGRFDPDYRREDVLERPGAYTGSGRFDPDYGREELLKRREVNEPQVFEEQELSSGTELTDDEETAEETDYEPQKSSVRKGAGYPQIAVDSFSERANSSAEKSSQGQVPARSCAAALFEVPKQVTKERAEIPLVCRLEGGGGPPSAPPMVAGMVLDIPESVPATPTFSTATAFSYDTEKKQQNSAAKPCEPSARSGSTMDDMGTPSHQNGTSAHRRGTSAPPAAPGYASGQAAWQAVIAYDACVRLCLRAWARGSMEAPEFLLDECALLRDCFGLQQLLLQPHEEGVKKVVSEDLGVSAGPKAKRTIGKVKVQVRKVKVITKQQAFRSSSLSALDTGTAQDLHGNRGANKKSILSTGWAAVRKIIPKHSIRSHNPPQRSMAYVNAGAHYVRQVSGILKEKVNSLRHSTLAEASQENFLCLLRLRSSPEEGAVRIQPGSGETSILLPESPGDYVLLDVQDSKGTSYGRLVIHISSITDDPSDRVRWYGIYNEPEHECVGKVQLFLSYTTTSGEVDAVKWGPVGETRAYDIVLEVAMRVQQFQRRNLRLHGSWLWLLAEFASCYGVSSSYTKLRYLACIMEVATPTEDCLALVHDLLCPIVKDRDENSINRQERRIFGEIEEQVEQLLAVVFENYKSLDEASNSGLAEVFTPAVGGIVAPALVPAVQIYTLLHDILSLESQSTLRNYFQIGAMKRCKRLMAETDEYVSSSSEGFLMDTLTMSTAYQKMRTLCLHISSEVRADIDIHNKHVLPSSIDLPNIAANIYDTELANRLRTFLVACPPTSPSPPVAELMIATADFQRDLVAWGIRAQKGGVDAKELFHLYVVLWIQDKRLHLLDFCKFDKERCTWVTTQHTTSPFVEEVYERIKDTLNEYEIIISRWPEYTVALENAVADVERAVIGALEKQYAEVLMPLKDVMAPKKFSLQYMQKLTRRRTIAIYSVPSQLGVMLNSLKRLLDTLRPKMETQMKAWVACLPGEGAGHGRVVFGERLNEVTIELRAKYKNFLQAIVEKLADNARLQRTTKLKKILQDTREAGGESDIRERMQPLNSQLVDTISHLHDVFTTRVFVAVCRGFWDRMARDVLHFLENRKENRSWYKGSSFALGILDDVFASQMQRLQGHALQEKDLEPPRSVAEARSMLSRDAPNGVDSSSLFFY